MLSQTDIKFFKIAVGSENIGKESLLDVSAKCPVCGDGRKGNSKRLHLYEKNGTTLVHCFNGDCPVHYNVWNFLKNHNPELLDSYKRETFGETMKTLGGNNYLPKQEVKINIKTIALESHLGKIEDFPQALEYVKSRNVEYDKERFGQWYFGIKDLNIDGILYKVKDSIIIPFFYNNLIYGFYSRSIDKKNFITYNHQINLGYKIWNWFGIDKNAPVYIFEGIFDAISSGKKNIIALAGAKLPEERLKELKYPVFCLDNDKTGILNAKNYAMSGYNVFIQPTDIIGKDFNEIKKNYPDLNMSTFINDNVHSGPIAQVLLTSKN